MYSALEDHLQDLHLPHFVSNWTIRSADIINWCLLVICSISFSIERGLKFDDILLGVPVVKLYTDFQKS